MNTQDKIKRILSAGKISQETLAGIIGVSFVTLNSWYNGRSEPKRTALIRKIDETFFEFLGHEDIAKQEVSNAKKQALECKISVKELVTHSHLLDKITLNLTYHTNTIEGSTMTLNDVQKVLFDQKTLKNRSQIEQREASNHSVALEYIINEIIEKKKITWSPKMIEHIHLLLMNGVISNAGIYRNHGARITSYPVVLANFIKIPHLIENLCNELNEETTDILNLVSRAHATFEQIHPFSDGNGRTGRLIIFAQLLQYGVVPPIILKQHRVAYYKYLELAQNHSRFDHLEWLIASEILNTSKMIGKA
jgi:Fic family protein